jgi:uncharacterized membrane protein
MFVHYVVKWHQSGQLNYFFWFSFLLGLITLIRPTEISIVIFPLLIGVTSYKAFKEKTLYYFKHEIFFNSWNYTFFHSNISSIIVLENSIWAVVVFFVWK